MNEVGRTVTGTGGRWNGKAEFGTEFGDSEIEAEETDFFCFWCGKCL